MKNLRRSLRNSKDWPARLVNRLGESISQSDDWQGTNRSWISCTRNWKASSPTISSARMDAPMRSRLMSAARKQFEIGRASCREREEDNEEAVLVKREEQ